MFIPGKPLASYGNAVGLCHSAAGRFGYQEREIIFSGVIEVKLPSGTKSEAKGISAFRILLVVAAAIVVVWFVRAHDGEAEEYRRYLSEDRPAIALGYEELSGDWTERTLKERFPNLNVRCYTDGSHGLGDRACALDVVSNNGVPTMFISFFFAHGHLNAAAFNVPWWAHGDALDDIVAKYGEPYAAQLLPHSGVRLMGWKLSDGRALFYNRDRDINPLIWNSVFWNSAEHCARNRCFFD